MRGKSVRRRENKFTLTYMLFSALVALHLTMFARCPCHAGKTFTYTQRRSDCYCYHHIECATHVYNLLLLLTYPSINECTRFDTQNTFAIR